MKVKITMEADVTNMPAYNEPVSGQENVYSVISEIYLNSLSKLIQIHSEAKNKPSVMEKAIIKAYESERDLTKQLANSVKIEYVP